MLRKIYAVSLFAFSTFAYADFCPCPSSFNLIHIGDPLAQVLKLCCAPTSQKTYTQEPPVPQKWTYYISDPSSSSNSVQNSRELTVAFDETGKVINLTVNAQRLTSTNCGTTSTASFSTNTPNTIQLGDTMKTVQATCGKPQFPPQKGLPHEMQQASVITELQYAGPPAVTLIFEDAKLKEIKK